MAEYTVDAALTVGVNSKYEPMRAATFNNRLDAFTTNKDEEQIDLDGCFSNFLSHVGSDFVLLREAYLEGLQALRLPDWVEKKISRRYS